MIIRFNAIVEDNYDGKLCCECIKPLKHGDEIIVVMDDDKEIIEETHKGCYALLEIK